MNEQTLNTLEPDMMGLTTDIVASYISSNKMAVADLTGLITAVAAFV